MFAGRRLAGRHEDMPPTTTAVASFEEGRLIAGDHAFDDDCVVRVPRLTDD